MPGLFRDEPVVDGLLPDEPPATDEGRLQLARPDRAAHRAVFAAHSLCDFWIWGEGSVVWLTGAGIEGAGLGGLRPVKSPRAPTTIAHGVLVGWSAARVERRGRVWKSARELAVDRERWAAGARCDRGRTELLPDLAVWLKRSEPPVAVIAESGRRREDHQKMILGGWRDAILSGRYAGVHDH